MHRSSFSAVIAWGMIPLATWAGMPSTGCVCANGQVKLFCGHSSGNGQHQRHSATNCAASCCGTHESEEHDADCCGGGFCCHGSTSEKASVTGKTCCTPILSAPSMAPQTCGVIFHEASLLVAVAEDIGVSATSSYSAELAEINTGPPFDRVIIFRSLLI